MKSFAHLLLLAGIVVALPACKKPVRKKEQTKETIEIIETRTEQTTDAKAPVKKF